MWPAEGTPVPEEVADNAGADDEDDAYEYGTEDDGFFDDAPAEGASTPVLSRDWPASVIWF